MIYLYLSNNMENSREGGNELQKDFMINLEDKYFNGNVLDIGLENNGIVYNLYKHNNKDFNVEYVEGKNETDNIQKNFYDSCIMFLSFSSVLFKLNKKNLIKEIHNYLKDNGVLHIWDINKGYGKTFEGTINVILPDEKVKKIDVKELNVFKDSSYKSVLHLLEENFNIILCKCKNDIYYIEAQKI